MQNPARAGFFNFCHSGSPQSGLSGIQKHARNTTLDSGFAAFAAPRNDGLGVFPQRLDAIPLERGLEQTELALHRIDLHAALGRGAVVDGGVEAAHFDLQLLRMLDQLLQLLG